MKKQNRASRFNLLLTVLMPFGACGCKPVAAAIVTVVIWFGNIIVTTVAGATLEKVLDKIFFPSQEKDGGAEIRGQQNEKAGEVIIDKNDTKKGVYIGTMKVRHEKTGQEAVITNPAVVRDSERSWTWTLDPRVKADVLKSLK